MKFLIWLFIGFCAAADVTDPESCSAFPCLIFEDNFDFFDHSIWEHEISLAGGGNWEFQAYVNNRSVSYTRGGTLYIKPALTSEWKDEAFLTTGNLNVWGMNGRGDVCTANSFFGCERQGTATNLVNPVLSARLRTQLNFSFKYGRIEIRAKMPRGDWLWPAAWLLPKYWPYGLWPASGEIDVLECRGNDNFGSLSNNVAGSTLHWGPYYELNKYLLTTADYSPSTGAFPDDFHIWAMEWTDTNIIFYLDGVQQLVIDPGTNFWDFGGFANEGDLDNIWQEGGKMAPFDQQFYIILNLAVGGTNGFFPDGIDLAKPWINTSPQAPLDFWNGRGLWLPTWEQGEGKISENAALQVDYVRVYKMTSNDISN